MASVNDDAVNMNDVTKGSEAPPPSSKAGCKVREIQFWTAVGQLQVNGESYINFLTQIVVRLLPSSMNESEFLEAVSPLPPYDYFYFVSAERSLEPHSFSRAYINIISLEDVINFRESFDGYVFVDSQGERYKCT